MWPLKCAVLLLVAGLTLANSDEGWKNAKSIYEFSALDIDGNKVDFNKYRGHVTLIVNVACKCLLTQEHYKKLSALYHKYSESKGLRIMAFPTNDFAKQEPLGRTRDQGVREAVRRHLRHVQQDQRERGQRPPALEVPEGEAAGLPLQRHQMELHQVSGGQERTAREALCTHRLVRNNRSRPSQVLLEE
uniref:Glutathione peroxidase n=2 Tax=Ixodes ricinus TaxID=34613 RepID=V5H0F2_IXORI